MKNFGNQILSGLTFSASLSVSGTKASDSCIGLRTSDQRWISNLKAICLHEVFPAMGTGTAIDWNGEGTCSPKFTTDGLTNNSDHEPAIIMNALAFLSSFVTGLVWQYSRSVKIEGEIAFIICDLFFPTIPVQGSSDLDYAFNFGYRGR